jgi:UDP-glucose 4-epimerase
MTKCLVIGGYGNLGKSLCQIEEWNAIPFGKNSWTNIELLNDIRADLLIFTAGSNNLPVNQFPEEFVDANIRSLSLTLDLLKKNEINRFYYISSCAVYGDATRTSEDSTLNPVSLNGYVKLLSERIVEEFCLKNNIEYTILRIFNMYGGLDRFSVLHHLVNSIKHNAPFYLYNEGRAQRDFIHVNDVARIIYNLHNCVNLPRIINIGTGNAFKVSEVISRFKIYHKSLNIVNKVCNEVEYSRADINILKSIIHFSFKSVFDYIDSNMNEEKKFI